MGRRILVEFNVVFAWSKIVSADAAKSRRWTKLFAKVVVDIYVVEF
jgi:hypothetical protein